MEIIKKDTAILIDGGFLTNVFMEKFSTEHQKVHIDAEQVIKLIADKTVTLNGQEPRAPFRRNG